MKIEVKKFGDLLVSRPSGKEAYLVFQSYMRPDTDTEPIEVDFTDVKVMTPSWADEFISALKRDYGDRVKLKASDNITVIESLKIIE